MKKTALFLVCLMAGITSSFAQRAGDSSLGLNLNYASETSFGIGARYQLNLTDHFRVEPEFNYYFKHDHNTFWDLSANVSYLIPISSDVAIYPVGGVGYMKGKDVDLDYIIPGVDVDSTTSSFQASLGIGAEFHVLPNAKIIIEPKYQFNDFKDTYSNFKNQFVLTAGIAYCF